MTDLDKIYPNQVPNKKTLQNGYRLAGRYDDQRLRALSQPHSAQNDAKPQANHRIKPIPPATITAAIIRCRPNASRKINVPIKAAKITLVSRSDETIAIEPSPMAKITSAYAVLDATAPITILPFLLAM